MSETQDVLFEEITGKGGNLGVITLNRPKVLNSLNHDMIVAMQPKLDEWSAKEDIKAVIIKAAPGRAFCAGGDLRLTYDRAKAHHPEMTEFFYDEYLLNRTIHHYPKPYIALLDGITMGGGVGVSIHGSHRVATENLLFAMPETGIGLFPDVGGTYFLPRLPGAIGYYLGLTGARIKSQDSTAIGLTTHTVQHDDLENIIDRIANTEFSEPAKQAVTKILDGFHQAEGDSTLIQSKDKFACFEAESIEGIIDALESQPEELSSKSLDILSKKSPTSLKVTLQALNNGRNMDFDACMRQEFRLVTRFLLGHDFIEGIRAVIIDKDQSPTWQPASISEVDESTVENYFSPLEKELAE